MDDTTVERHRHRPPPTAHRPLSQAAAAAWIPRTCFKHGPPGRVGVELELLVRKSGRPADPTDGPEYDPWRAAALAVGVLGRVTLEPGGQLELSGRPADDLTTCLAETAADLAVLRALAAGHGLELVGAGVDDRDVRRRVLREPRYAAMEAYLDRRGPAGRTMMRRTASVQVNLEAEAQGAGPVPADHRWRLLHDLGPVLVAAFANSPGGAGPWPGWAAGRLGAWLDLDPSRTEEPVGEPAESHHDTWTRWCLDAPLMMVRRPGPDWSAPPGVSFRDWIEGGPAVVPGRDGPTVDDLAYHLTTLFPPVRARGHLEVRYLDALPGDWWQVPVGVLWALAVDEEAARRARSAAAPYRGRWRDAARRGLRDPGLAAAAVEVLETALTSLRTCPGGAGAVPALEAYLDRWTRRARSPGDDRLAGRPVPAAPAPPPVPSPVPTAASTVVPTAASTVLPIVASTAVPTTSSSTVPSPVRENRPW